MSPLTYEVRRSARRTRTMTVLREAGRVVVVVPALMTAHEERRVVPPFVARFLASETARSLPPADPDLQERAETLFEAHLRPIAPDFDLKVSVRWSARQQHRWGSATPAEGTIRISERLRTLPRWVGDYVLVHELAHLLETNHTARFWELVARYPLAERARGYLEGFSAAQGWAAEDES